MSTPRNTQLAPSSQVIVSAIIAAAIDVALVMAIMLYANFTGRWGLGTIDLCTLALVISMALLTTEIVRAIRAHEQLQLRDQAAPDTDTQPQPVAPPTTLRRYYPS